MSTRSTSLFERVFGRCMHTGTDPRRRGSALIASLMVVMVVAGLGVCLIRLHSASTRRQVHLIDRKRAFYVAEAGLSEAFLAISQGKSGRVGSEEVPAAFGAGVYWVDATPTEDGNIELKSNGLCGVGRVSLSIVLRPQVDPVAARGVFSGTDLIVQPGVVVDGFDSSKGTYAEQLAAAGNGEHTDGGAMLMSNEDVLLLSSNGGLLPLPLPFPDGNGAVDGETQVYGEVHPGPLGSMIMEPGVYVSGSTTPTNHVGLMPTVDVPQAPNAGTMIVPSGQTLTLSRKEVSFDHLVVRSGGQLVLAGPLTLVVGRLSTVDRSRVMFDTSAGRITVIVEDQLEIKPGTRFASSEKDTKRASLVVLASEWTDVNGDSIPDPPIVFKPDGEFFGFLYVPYTALELPSTLRFFGAVAAESLTLLAGFRMTVDQAMADGEKGDGTLPRYMAWRIVELPDTPLVNVRLDPRGVLNLQGVVPIPSDKAHAESNVQVDYFDTAGALQSYTGSAAALDWTDVNTVVAINWN